MQSIPISKGFVISFVVFMLVFSANGQPVAGFFIWLHFAMFVMPRSWH